MAQEVFTSLVPPKLTTADTSAEMSSHVVHMVASKEHHSRKVLEIHNIYIYIYVVSYIYIYIYPYSIEIYT